ncbi:YihY/virulence factor BrkB family protein [Paraliomyxa miuraensis]|uniref:YihY/virulence factor BrkB family protein n=1 Tax=Paraliomyxa miuraensis TaxID=376150 RepID=UPI0022525B61|nr:YhjD/YihY/BrkB family envelope integrity protein [Paraliomyxa miuraensis]MCX4240052.1 YihY family inner membrane protein [Paraliomyxa miuraensis]
MANDVPADDALDDAPVDDAPADDAPAADALEDSDDSSPTIEPATSASSRADPLAGLRTRITRLRASLVPRLPEVEPTRWRRVWLLSFFVLRRWIIEDRCGGMAALLTMHTLLSTVPFLGVTLLIVGLMDPVSGTALLEDIFRSLVPETERAAQMATAAMGLAARVNVGNLGAWGFLVTLSIAFVLFSTLEQTFNRIWRVSRKRSVLVKFTMFYTLATLGPALMLYSLAQPLVAGVTRMVGLPVLTTGAGLVLLNRYMPHTAVRWGPALTGGLVTAVLIEIGKVVFGIYATRFALQTYEGLYGPLAVFPIIIVWSYLSWMVILLGAQIAFVVQRRRYIALQGYLNRYVRERIEVPNDSGRTAARLLLAICDRYSRRGRGLSPEELGERFRLALDRVSELLGQLHKHGYIVDTDTDDEAQVFVPARPLDQIKLIDVLVLFDHEQSQQTRADLLGKVFEDLDEARLRIVAETSYAELVRKPRG